MKNQEKSPENGRPRVGIVVGGGPAPGINGAISAITLEARSRGYEVLGIMDGFSWLMAGKTDHVRKLDREEVSRIHFQGGSILNTSRANPTKNPEDMKRVLDGLEALGIRYLATIGGDDTMFAASEVARHSAGKIRVCHVPKTIDNDLPLPGEIPTFGFETARQLGFELVHNLMEDSRTTGRWYFVVVMGRAAGHLALGIGKAVGATLTVIPEEFPGPVHVEAVCDVLEGAILKRRLFNRSDGVALIAEGLIEKMPQEELTRIEGVRIMRDAYGHLRLAELDLAHILKIMVERRFAERGSAMTIVHKTIGYEVRCAPPIAFDCEYVRALGYGAVEFLLNPKPENASLNGALVCLENGKISYLRFEELMNPQTGKTRVRLVDITKPSYRVAREYMIRLEREDFDDEARLEALALARSTPARTCTPADFRDKFQYVVTQLHGAI
ncbi:MAG TPA: diphosphate--fructose-6-phosphate 1-phosphotransferase [Candidatus Acidoferrales bacterium]|nr:diphosphate--fructose-6-phosphate 1-phosphotransferase [Candidatus Acidoferrales bacterium]